MLSGHAFGSKNSSTIGQSVYAEYFFFVLCVPLGLCLSDWREAYTNLCMPNCKNHKLLAHRGCTHKLMFMFLDLLLPCSHFIQ